MHAHPADAFAGRERRVDALHAGRTNVPNREFWGSRKRDAISAPRLSRILSRAWRDGAGASGSASLWRGCGVLPEGCKHHSVAALCRSTRRYLPSPEERNRSRETVRVGGEKKGKVRDMQTRETN